MALDWHRLVDGHTLDQLHAHFGLSERALVHCLEHGLTTVRRIRHALALDDAAWALDAQTHRELTALLATYTPPPRTPRAAPPPRRSTPKPQPTPPKPAAPQRRWPGLPAAVCERMAVDPDLDVRLLLAHLSPRAQRALAGYLAPEYAMADLDKLVFSNLAFSKFRGIGASSVGELDHWRMELRYLRAAAQLRQASLSADG